MGRLYTLDNKLLVDTPEIRIGDKLYPVDDRQKTVKKLMAVENKEDPEAIDRALELGLGKAAQKEIDAMNLPFRAQQRIFELVLAAMIGEDPEDARFQKETESAK